MNRICKQKFKSLLVDYGVKYKKIFDEIPKMIGEIDLIKSGAKTSLQYNYCKPTITKSKNSYINSKDMRHPIIEQIQTKSIYIPNDCNIGINSNQNGILLYGINASGKSSYMKSVGLNIILAQAGFYVAAKSFDFSPYTQIFTRISGNDNIFKGHSSFAVEMLELRNILLRSDSNSLILGDELCKGTESLSALAIVSSGIETLTNKKSHFIFATHLHGLSKIEEIQNIPSVKSYHLSIENRNGKLIYNRKLKEGSGESCMISTCTVLNFFLVCFFELLISNSNSVPSVVLI